MSDRPPEDDHFTEWMLGLLALAIVAVFIAAAFAYEDAGEGPTAAQSWNAACRGHDGVRRMEGMGNLAICRDGRVVER